MPNMKEKILTWICWHLPKDLVYWCAVRVMANATIGIYSKQLVTDLRALEALQRWND